MSIQVSENILLICNEIRSRVYSKSQEFAGSISEYGFTCEEGKTDKVQADLEASFSWHYHPKDNLDFSLSDWIVFILSESQMTALFTDSRVLLISKNYSEEHCSIMKNDIFRIHRVDSHYPALIFAKTIRLLNRYFDCSFESDSFEKICKKAGFSFCYLKFKEGVGYVLDNCNE